MSVLPFEKPQSDSRFEEIWKMWPVKAKKPLARARYLAIISGSFRTRTLDKDSGQYVEIEHGATEEEVLKGVKDYLASQVDRNTFKMKDGGKYIPHLATFLNQGRYADLS